MTSRQAYAPSLHLENVAVIRGNRMVLSNLNLSVKAGELVWVRGANGCGKSTLLRVIAGLLDAYSGKVLAEGKLALADENLALDPNLTVAAALQFWAHMDGASPSDRDAALVAMDLLALSEVPVRYLSTGQRKRASIARVLASGCAIWLLDEPYNGLDSASCAHLDKAILSHIASGGIVMLAAHQSPSINISESLVLDAKGRSL
ncbi:MAG: heme ABC exporter ATP-binding protein CcmA [Sphingopyxis sp.]|nr:heme ABC exporter ATP-binding protein CcmA [Sphingopyxis sp.]